MHRYLCRRQPRKSYTLSGRPRRKNRWGDRAQTLCHRWGEPLPKADLILGGDILYRPELHRQLCTSIASSQAKLAIISDPRQNLEPELTQYATLAGLQLGQHYDEERRCSWVQLYPSTSVVPD